MKPGRRRFRDAKGIGVVETQRCRHSDAVPGKCRAHQWQRPGIGVFEQFLGNRAGIFGIDIDIALLQRFPENTRAAKLPAMGGRDLFGADEVGGDFAEDDGFGEFLGPDSDILRRRRQGEKHGEQ